MADKAVGSRFFSGFAHLDQEDRLKMRREVRVRLAALSDSGLTHHLKSAALHKGRYTERDVDALIDEVHRRMG